MHLGLKWICKIAHYGKRIQFTCGLICWSKSVGIEGASIICPNSVFFCFRKINLFVILLQDLFIHAGNLMICWTPISRNFPTKQHLYWTIEKRQCSYRQTNPCAISQLVTLLASRKISPCSNEYVSKKQCVENRLKYNLFDFTFYIFYLSESRTSCTWVYRRPSTGSLKDRAENWHLFHCLFAVGGETHHSQL